MADDHTPDPELVTRGLGGDVEEGPDDVAGAVAEEEEGIGDDFFGVAGGVGGGEGED